MEGNANLDIFVFCDRQFEICPKNPCYKLVSMNDFDTDSMLEKVICTIDSHPLMKMNHSYSEACRIKWLRDNYQLKDYVGTNHYRRYFEFFDNIPDMDALFKEHDAILPNFNLPYKTIIDHYKTVHNIDDLNLVLEIIKKHFTEYYDTAIDVLNKKHFVPCNIFIMKRENFIEMCDFMFGVLEKYDELLGFKTDLDVYNHVVNNLSKYRGDTTYQSRIQAFLSERLSFIYYMTKLKNPLYVDMVLTEVHADFEKSWFKLYKPKEEEIYSPGVSICISAWKTAEYIEECLDSVVNQTWFKKNDNWEIILGIDGCIETLEKVNLIRGKYKNLRVFMMDTNVGTYITCNTIMSEARYQWLLRFDSDDVMPEDMVEKIFSNDLEEYDVVRYQHNDFSTTQNKMCGFAYGSHMIKHKVFDKYGGYRDWRISADYDLLYRIEPETKTLYLGNVHYNRRMRENSLEHANETSMTSDKRRELNSFVANESRNQKKIENIIGEYKEINREGIIVSMTTWPKRDKYLPKMLENFKKQTVKPDKIILWLSEDEYNRNNIPDHIMDCLVDGLLTDIKWVKKNTYCHKRFEAFKYFNDCYNIFVDDDIIYPDDFVEKLYTTGKYNRNCVIVYSTNSMDYDGYKVNKKEAIIGASMYNALMGGCCCYPPNILPNEVFEKIELRDKYVTKCDESWVRPILIKHNINIYAIKTYNCGHYKTIDDTQECSMWNENKVVFTNNMREKERNFYNAIKIHNCEKACKQLWPKMNIDQWELKTKEEM